MFYRKIQEKIIKVLLLHISNLDSVRVKSNDLKFPKIILFGDDGTLVTSSELKIFPRFQEPYFER